jgi:hypothetical protein
MLPLHLVTERCPSVFDLSHLLVSGDIDLKDLSYAIREERPPFRSAFKELNFGGC